MHSKGRFRGPKIARRRACCRYNGADGPPCLFPVDAFIDQLQRGKCIGKPGIKLNGHCCRYTGFECACGP